MKIVEVYQAFCKILYQESYAIIRLVYIHEQFCNALHSNKTEFLIVAAVAC